MSDEWSGFIGGEHRVGEVSYALRSHIESFPAKVVGAHQINCSDESEREVVESFHTIVVRTLLPELKYWSRSSFRTVNLGGRYEKGSLAVAEDHYAAAGEDDDLKVMMVKVNSHVSITEESGKPVYGRMDRYERECVYCGALHALLGDLEGEFVDRLRATMQSGGIDRLAMLRDPAQVRPEYVKLFAAIANARLQAQAAVADAVEIDTHSPTIFLVVPAVTLNRQEEDTELVVGSYLFDARAGLQPVYEGLGDDPSKYVIDSSRPRLRVTD